MEFADNVSSEGKSGHADANMNNKDKGFVGKFARHKIMFAIIIATMGFIILDVMLIMSFINVLAM